MFILAMTLEPTPKPQTAQIFIVITFRESIDKKPKTS